MGEIVFVPKADLPGYGDGNSSGFVALVSLDCTVTGIEIALSIEGPNGNYDWEILDVNDVSICSGTVAHNGTSPYDICAGTLLANQYYIIRIDNAANKTEVITFDTFHVCGVFAATQAVYNCNTGLLITGVPSETATVLIEKGVDSESVAYPFVSDVFLEDGTYSITVDDSLIGEITVNCAISSIEAITACDASNAPNIIVVVQNIVHDEDYTLNIYDTAEVPAIVHTEVFNSPSFGVSGVENEYSTTAIEVHEFNVTPPIADLTGYTVEIEHTGLNAKSYTGTFNATIVDQTEAVTTLDCGTVGDIRDVKITNFQCLDAPLYGFSFDVELLNEDNLASLVYLVYDENDLVIFSDYVQYVGTNPIRTVTVLESSTPSMQTPGWYVKLQSIEGVTGGNTTWYNDIDIYVPEILPVGCLACGPNLA